MFLGRLVRWPSVDIQVKFYGDGPRGNPPLGKLNTTEVAKYSDFVPIERYISETVQISLNSVAFGADYVKVVEDTPILSSA